MYGGCERERFPFWESPLCRLQKVSSDDRVVPVIEVKDDALIYYFRLCKSGYASSIKEAAELDARTVLQALNYEKFINDYEIAYMELNK